MNESSNESINHQSSINQNHISRFVCLRTNFTIIARYHFFESEMITITDLHTTG